MPALASVAGPLGALRRNSPFLGQRRRRAGSAGFLVTRTGADALRALHLADRRRLGATSYAPLPGKEATQGSFGQTGL